jgi:hypothetical protein
MVLPFVDIKGVVKAIGEMWQETEDSEHSGMQFNGSKTYALCVLSAVAVLMSHQHNICMIMWPHLPEDQGLNISCTEFWLLVFNSLLARSVCCLCFDL